MIVEGSVFCEKSEVLGLAGAFGMVVRWWASEQLEQLAGKQKKGRLL